MSVSSRISLPEDHRVHPTKTADKGAGLAEAIDNPLPTLDVAEKEDSPPNGGYGWVCTACVFFINAHTWGVNSVSTSPLSTSLVTD